MRGQDSGAMQHLTSLLLMLLCVGTARTTYTISTANRLTAQATTLSQSPQNAKTQFIKLLDRSNWTFDGSDNSFQCDCEEKAV